MKKAKTSYEKKNKKEEPKIVFEDFPYEDKKNELGTDKKQKNIILPTLIVLFFIVLFILSSVLNEWILYGNESNDYNLVNKFKENYAIIEPNSRMNLFKEIGFDVSKTKTEIMNGKNYVTTYAYHKVQDDASFADAISVYYDDKYEVSYVLLSLIYKKEEFSISKVAADCDAIIMNFVKVDTPKKAISEALNNGYYFLKDNVTKADVSYRVINDSDDKHYVLTVMIEK